MIFFPSKKNADERFIVILFYMSWIWTRASTWPLWLFPIWCVAVVLGLEILNTIAAYIPPLFFSPKSKIPVRGKPLERFVNTDYAYIWFNKLLSCLFSYHVLQFCALSGKISLTLDEFTILDVLICLPLCFIVYDLPYYLFHRALHLPSLYGLVHKHHHRQMAPSRANYDAINVHPFEMLVGEYLHLASIAFVAYLPFVRMHVISVIAFLGVGGILASLNHTRYPIHASLALYDVRAHDQHHVQPRCNYSQYSMFWDYAFSTFQKNPVMQ
jgi:sterol desaturase/sphingolipid hydroxylase (fatty acid hydroxylase superfamily)